DGPLPWPGTIADNLSQLTPGASITVPDVLFAKIEDTQVAEWTQRFGGAGGEKS
ncbi:MAG: methionyl-tRNA synthetase, partial [Verrucomicrobiota bacterium]